MSEFYNPFSWDWSGLLGGDSAGSNGGPKTGLQRMEEERASARRNAHFASLMKTMSEIGRQGRLTPYPEQIAPIDLSKSQAAYNASMAQDMKYNELRRKQRSREAMMKGFGVLSGTTPAPAATPVSDMAGRYMAPRVPNLLYANTPIDRSEGDVDSFTVEQMQSWNDPRFTPPVIPITRYHASLRAERPRPRPEGMANALQLVHGWEDQSRSDAPTIRGKGGTVVRHQPPGGQPTARARRPQGGSAQVAPFLRSIPPAYHSFAQQLARHDPKQALEFVGKVISAQAKPSSPQWHNIIATKRGETLRRRVDTAGLRDLENQGYTISADKPEPASVSVRTEANIRTQAGLGSLKRSDKVHAEASEADGTILSVNRLSGIIDDIVASGGTTGMGQEAKLAWNRFTTMLGWTSERKAASIKNAEVFNAEAKKFILPLVKMLGVNPTDKDLAFVVEASPELMKSIRGNQFLLKAIRVDAQRKIALAKFDSDFMRANRESLTDSPLVYRIDRQEALRDFKNKHELWVKGKLRIPEELLDTIDTSGVPEKFR